MTGLLDVLSDKCINWRDLEDNAVLSEDSIFSFRVITYYVATPNFKTDEAVSMIALYEEDL